MSSPAQTKNQPEGSKKTNKLFKRKCFSKPTWARKNEYFMPTS